MADGTVIQFEAALGIDCVKVCTVISVFPFSFLHFETLYQSKDNTSFFPVCSKISNIPFLKFVYRKVMRY